MSAEVKHSGVITSIEGDNILVSIISKAACLSCKVNSSCNSSEMSEKIMELKANDLDWEIGEYVNVALKESAGFKALLVGYVLPFFILLFTLIALLEYSNNELLAGLVALFMLVPYYLLVFLFKDKLKKQFQLFLEKQ